MALRRSPGWAQTGAMDFQAIARVRLRQGAGGGDPRDGFCVMELVSWISGDDRATDEPACASPALTALAIALNDGAPSPDLRDALKPFALRLLNTRDPAHERRREVFAIRAIAHRVLAPLMVDFELRPAAEMLNRAQTLRETAAAARAADASLCNVVRSFAWANARAASARLAAAATDRADLVHRTLRDALYSSLCAADGFGRKEELWRAALTILDDAIALGRCPAHPAPMGAAPPSPAATKAARC